MKRTILYMAIAFAMIIMDPSVVLAQQSTPTIVNVTTLKTKWPEKGSVSARDSLIALYNANVVMKNDKILSHREYAHYFTGSSQDYMVIEEYADLAGMEAAFDMTTELEKKAWPDEAKRKEFMDAMGSYFETWHGDALYHANPKLAKN